MLDTFELNKDTISGLRDELDKVIQKFGQENSISVKLGYIRYGSDHFKTTIEGSIDNGDGLTFEAREFTKNCGLYGLHPENLGSEFMTDTGRCMMITGLKIRNRKYPILAKEVDTGKRFKYSAEYVRGVLDNQEEG